MNNYDALCVQYAKSDVKPDKQWSMLPTILALLEPYEGLRAVDVGCGRGFFTTPIAQKARHVTAIDTSAEQLRNAAARENITYTQADMRTFTYPACERICAPFVLGYVQRPEELQELFLRMHAGLLPGGKLVSVLDMPRRTEHDMRTFGAVKRVPALTEGAPLSIDLYAGGSQLCTLQAWYHEPHTIEAALHNAGFSKVSWPQPIVSSEGVAQYGREFWDQYLADCDVAYLVAQK